MHFTVFNSIYGLICVKWRLSILGLITIMSNVCEWLTNVFIVYRMQWQMLSSHLLVTLLLHRPETKQSGSGSPVCEYTPCLLHQCTTQVIGSYGILRVLNTTLCITLQSEYEVCYFIKWKKDDGVTVEVLRCELIRELRTLGFCRRLFYIYSYNCMKQVI